MRKDRLNTALLVLGIAAAIAAVFVDKFTSNVLMWIAMNALLASSLRFVMLVGEFNMAVVAFYAVGAYGSALATTAWKLPLLVSVFGGAAVAALVAVAFGYITMRVKGPYFMLISFAFAEVLRLLLSRWDTVEKAIETVDSVDPKKVAAALPKIIFESSYGPSAFNYAEEYGLPNQMMLPILVTQIKGGKTVELKRLNPPQLQARLKK